MKELGVIAAGETPTAEDAADAFAALNRLVDQWKAERLQMFALIRTVFTITSNVGSYSVGLGGAVNLDAPNFVEGVSFQDSAVTPLLEYPLDELTDDAYIGVRLKTFTSPFPTSFWYNATVPLANLVLWPTPTLGTLQGVFYSPQPVSTFAALTTAIVLPPGYERMIVKGLALELAPSYQRQPDQLLLQQAIQARAVVKASNSKLSDLGFSADALIGNAGGSWSIYTDS